MLIVSKIQRKGGSRVTVMGADYHFKPAPTGEHLCEVEDPEHIERLLSIPEGFEPYRADEPRPAVPADPEPTPEQRLERAVEPESATDAPEAGDDDAEADLELAVEPDNSDGLDEYSDHDLVYAYKDQYGTAPSKNMKRATIIKRIREMTAPTKH